VSRLATAVLAALLLALTTAPAASAHTELKSSTPADNAVVTAVPDTVTLTFNAAVTATPGSVRLFAPTGAEWKVSSVTAEGPTVTAAAVPPNEPGVHTLSYSVESADGHTVRGTTKFTIAPEAFPATTTPGTTTAPPAATTTPGVTTTQSHAINDTPPSIVSEFTGQNTAAPAEDGLPTWLWLAIGAAVLAAALASGLFLRGRKGKEQ
jgi:methionine-rich copper-binding protein CopC